MVDIRDCLLIGEPKDITIFVKRCYETGRERPMKECVECEWHIWSMMFGTQCSFPEGEKNDR